MVAAVAAEWAVVARAEPAFSEGEAGRPDYERQAPSTAGEAGQAAAAAAQAAFWL